jgi:hypothetical protein
MVTSAKVKRSKWSKDKSKLGYVEGQPSVGGGKLNYGTTYQEAPFV